MFPRGLKDFLQVRLETKFLKKTRKKLVFIWHDFIGFRKKISTESTLKIV